MVTLLADTISRGNRKIKYEFLAKGSSFVVAKDYCGEPNQGKPISTHLYYVGKPYCAFLEVTFKPNLINPVHGILARKSNGFKKAQLNFRLLPKKLLGSDYYFNIVSYDNSGNSGAAKVIFFNDLTNMTKVRYRTLLTHTYIGIYID